MQTAHHLFSAKAAPECSKQRDHSSSQHSAAQQIRSDLTLEQMLDLIVAIARIGGSPEYVEPMLQTTLDGFRVPAQTNPPGPTDSA